MIEHATPVDGNAAKVIRPAAPENLWLPKPKQMAHKAHSVNVLETAPIPRTASEMSKLLGMRRDRMTIVGYAADQPANREKAARWVVRCDCGNFEHRTKILRWLGTQAMDMCDECRLRGYKTHGSLFPRERAERY